jgi:hypothetical protein
MLGAMNCAPTDKHVINDKTCAAQPTHATFVQTTHWRAQGYSQEKSAIKAGFHSAKAWKIRRKSA